MARLEIRTFIRAPRSRVWQVISDLGSQQRWMVDVRRLEIVSEQKGGVGTVIDITSELFGLPLLHDVMEITAWDENERLAVVHQGRFTGKAEFRLEEAPGGTVFVWTEEFRPPLGLLGELANTLVVGPHLRRVWSRSMDNVRRLAEGDTGPTAK